MTFDMCCAVLLLFHMLFIILVCITNAHFHNVPVVVPVKLFLFLIDLTIIFDLAFAFFSSNSFFTHLKKNNVKVINWRFHPASEEGKA